MGNSRTMRIVLPLPLNRANSRLHWRAEKRAKDDYFLRCRIARWKPTPAEPMTRATIKATLYTWSQMDTDNLMARLKWPVDWLVRNGYIVDDSPDVLVWTLPRQAIDRKRQRIEIDLEAIHDYEPPEAA